MRLVAGEISVLEEFMAYVLMLGFDSFDDGLG